MLLLLVPFAEAREVVEVTEGTVVVDGSLDDPAWAAAAPISDFRRFQPTDGGSPPGSTEVRFLQDDRFLYVGVRVRGADYAVRARITPREAFGDDDQIGVYLDPFGDAANGYVFYLNPLGLQEDTRHEGGAGFEAWNFSWDTLWYSEGRLVDGGYDLEVAIPFRSLKFPAGGGPQDWGVMVTRKIPSQGAKYGFPDLQRNHPQMWTQAAALQVSTPPRGSGLELVPGLTVIQQGELGADGDLTWSGFEQPFDAARPSLDLRYGLTPSIGLTATVNPDFSQVENDETPIGLNQRFSFYFPERRPFFLDGREYFSDPPETLYSRSIVEPVYGAKAYGKSGPWSLGALHALDRSPSPSVNAEGTPGFGTKDVEGALALNTVARLERQIAEGGSLSFIAADKELVDASGAIGGTNRLLGFDGLVPLGDRWSVMGAAQASHTAAAGTEAITGMDRALIVDRASGEGTGFSARVIDITPGHRRETGFLTLSGMTFVAASLDHTFEVDRSVDTLVPSVGVEVLEERDGDGMITAFGEQELVLADVHAVEVGAGAARYDEAGVSVDGAYAWLEYEGEAGAALGWAADVEISRELDYDQLVPADRVGGALGATFRPSAGVRLDTTFKVERLAPVGFDPELANLLRARLAWQFTRELGLRVIAEHTSGTAFDPRLTSSVLVGWLHHPGTALYAGYAETTDLLAGRPTDRTVFAKGTFLVRI